jgi:hypothetical protein
MKFLPKPNALLAFGLLLFLSCSRTDGSLKNEGNILAGKFAEQKNDLLELIDRTDEASRLSTEALNEIRENPASFGGDSIGRVRQKFTDSLIQELETHRLQINALREDASRLRTTLNRDHQAFNEVYQKTLSNKLSNDAATRQIQSSAKTLELITNRIGYARRKYTQTVTAYNENLRHLTQSNPSYSALSTYRINPLREKIGGAE